MTQFASDMKKAYQKKVIGRLERTVRAVALTVDAELINTTPVDTGRARANWLPTLNVPANYTNVSVTPQTVDEVFGSFKLTDTILLTNNLPYIQSLNDGSSKQAPKNFVSDAIQKGRRSIK